MCMASRSFHTLSRRAAIQIATPVHSFRPSFRLNLLQHQLRSMSNENAGSAPQQRAQDPSNDPNHNSTDGELNQWKFRAPYKIHNPSDPDYKPLYNGSCHCGKVKFQLSRERPLDAKICHCRTCQKLHGSPLQWCAIFHKDDINFTHGHHDLGWYESSEKTCEHKLPCKVSCSYCRTPIMDEGRNMILLFPTLIDFENPEDRKKFEPSYDFPPL